MKTSPIRRLQKHKDYIKHREKRILASTERYHQLGWVYEKDKHAQHQLKWVQKNRKRSLATHRLHYAIKTGKIKKAKKCSFCGQKEKIQGHIPNPEKPLEVIWLCRWCNWERYKRRRREIWKQELKELGL